MTLTPAMQSLTTNLEQRSARHMFAIETERTGSARAGSESVSPTTRAHAREVVQLCGCEDVRASECEG